MATSYKINVTDSQLEQLRQKLSSTRFPDELDAAGWAYGAPLADIKRLAAYWNTGFSWRDAERKLNDSLPQFTTPIDVDGFGALEVHFVHQRSAVDGAIPFLFVHGCEYLNPISFLKED
jgi:hypothetical protein